MKNVMRLLSCGVLLCLAIGCRNSTPPKLSLICIGDGVGGADCVDGDGNKVYKRPSELKNFWMTTEADEANFSSWCYDTSQSNIDGEMAKIEQTAHR